MLDSNSTQPPRRLRILMIISHFAPTIGGAERQAEGLSRALITAGHHVEVLTLALPGLPKEENLNGIIVHRKLRGVALGPLWGWTYAASVALFLLRNKRRFDLLHVHQLYIHAGVAAGLRRTLGFPVIAKAVNSGLESDFLRLSRLRGGRFWLRRLKNLDRVVCLTRLIEDECLEWNIPADRRVRIPNFVDTKKFAPFREAPREIRRLLYMGRLDYTKGPDVLIEAFALVRARLPQLTLTIAGRDDVTNLRRLATEHGIADAITFAGLQKDPIPLYRDSDIVVIPSRAEGLCNVLLEAMACGIPVVATAAGGNPESLGVESADGSVNFDGRKWIEAHGGLLCPSENPEPLAVAIEALVADSALALRVARAGRTRAEEFYSLEKIVARYLTLYEELTR